MAATVSPVNSFRNRDGTGHEQAAPSLAAGIRRHNTGNSTIDHPPLVEEPPPPYSLESVRTVLTPSRSSSRRTDANPSRRRQQELTPESPVSPHSPLQQPSGLNSPIQSQSRSLSPVREQPSEPMPFPTPEVRQAPFPTLSLRSLHADLGKGFPATLPQGASDMPHPFHSRHVPEEDWLRFLHDIQITASPTETQKVAEMVAMPLGFMIGGPCLAVAMRRGIRGSNIGGTREVIRNWNEKYFQPRGMTVALFREPTSQSPPSLFLPANYNFSLEHKARGQNSRNATFCNRDTAQVRRAEWAAQRQQRACCGGGGRLRNVRFVLTVNSC